VPEQDQSAELPSQPKLSVVITARNCVDSLRGALESLRDAGGDKGALEVVVVDLGSVDGCAEIDSEFPWIVTQRLPRNFGKARAKNIGLRTAAGQYVALMDPRVRVEKETLERIVAALESRTDASAAIPAITNENGEPAASAYRLPSPKELLEACLSNRPLAEEIPSGETVEAAREWLIVVRKNFIAGMNYFDEKRFWQFWSELDLFRQIRGAGKKVLVVREARALIDGDEPGAQTNDGRILEIADRVAGGASYVGKIGGVMAGIGFRLRAILISLGRGVTFRESGMYLLVFTALLRGDRIDGNQSGELA